MNSIYGEHYNPTIKPTINLDDVREVCEALITLQHPLHCDFCNKDDYYAKHDDDCPVTKAKRLLEQIGEKE